MKRHVLCPILLVLVFLMLMCGFGCSNKKNPAHTEKQLAVDLTGDGIADHVRLKLCRLAPESGRPDNRLTVMNKEATYEFDLGSFTALTGELFTIRLASGKTALGVLANAGGSYQLQYFFAIVWDGDGLAELPLPRFGAMEDAPFIGVDAEAVLQDSYLAAIRSHSTRFSRLLPLESNRYTAMGLSVYDENGKLTGNYAGTVEPASMIALHPEKDRDTVSITQYVWGLSRADSWGYLETVFTWDAAETLTYLETSFTPATGY